MNLVTPPICQTASGHAPLRAGDAAACGLMVDALQNPYESPSLRAADVIERRELSQTARHGMLGLLALADQALVSGASLLTTVIVGRFCSEQQLGIYTLGFTIVVLLICAQDSLITTPYTIYACRLPADERRDYTTSAALQSGLLGILAALGFAITACIFSVGLGPLDRAGFIWALSAAAPCVLLREFARRFALAELRMKVTVLIDAAMVALQFVFLSGLAGAGWMSARNAYLAIAMANGLVGLCWIASNRQTFGPWKHRLRADMRRNWTLGRWILAGQVAFLAQAFGLVWLLAMQLGAKQAGIFAACNSIILFSNPFLLGIGNVLGPKAALAYANSGESMLRRIILWGTVVLAAPVVIFSLVVALFGGEAVRLMYGKQYAGYGPVVALLALGLLINSLGLATDIGLRTVEGAHWNLLAGVAGTIVMLSVAVVLAPRWGVLGAAWASVASQITGASLKSAAFWLRRAPATEGGVSP